MINSNPTPYTDLNQVLADLVAGIQEILAPNFVGFYLQGSFAVGDFDQHSDVDFIVVTETELLAETVTLLQEMHGRIFNLPCPWAQHLEGSYIPRHTLRQPPQPDSNLWFLDHGSRSLIPSDHCNTLVVRWALREKGIPLAGPPTSTLLDPVSGDALRGEIRETIKDWGIEILDDPQQFNNRFYQGFIVLSYCRMLHSVVTGTVESKRAGADWAKKNLDPRWSGLIDRSWNGRPDPAHSVRQPADPADFEKTLQFVQVIINSVS